MLVTKYKRWQQAANISERPVTVDSSQVIRISELNGTESNERRAVYWDASHKVHLALTLTLTLADRNVPQGRLAVQAIHQCSRPDISLPVAPTRILDRCTVALCLYRPVAFVATRKGDYKTRYKTNAWNLVFILGNDNSFGVFGKKSVARTVGRMTNRRHGELYLHGTIRTLLGLSDRDGVR